MITKTERVALVATKEQLASWKLAADRAGLSLSELLRQAAEKHVLADARRSGQRIDLDRFLDLCREHELDVEKILREFACRGRAGR